MNSDPSKVEMKEKEIVLSRPKSSYYPFYLQQSGIKGKVSQYNTYNNHPKLRGYKKYPIKANIKDHQPTENQESMKSAFRPLPEGTKFTGKVKFHNLRKAEIGALLSTLTFHGMPEGLYFNIGYAKSFGYGIVTITTDLSTLQFTLEDYLKSFEYEMLTNDPSWHTSDYVKEYLAMCSMAPERLNGELEYMPLQDFKSIKEEKKYLKDYSEISGIKPSLIKYITDTEINQLTDAKQKEQKLLAALKEQIQEEERLMKLFIAKEKEKEIFNKAIESYDMEILGSFLTNYPNSTYTQKIYDKIAELKTEKTKSVFEEASAKRYGSKDFSFNSIKKYANGLMKTKNYALNREQKSDLATALKKSYKIEIQNPKKSAFHKKKKLAEFHQYPWTDIKKWLGEDDALSLYNSINT